MNTYLILKCCKFYNIYLTIVIGSDFVTMIQIDCAVTDTKTLHIRDSHLRHNNDFKNNISSNLKQHDGIYFAIFYCINLYLSR